jgi:hypothetical protein
MATDNAELGRCVCDTFEIDYILYGYIHFGLGECVIFNSRQEISQQSESARRNLQDI